MESGHVNRNLALKNQKISGKMLCNSMFTIYYKLFIVGLHIRDNVSELKDKSGINTIIF